MSDAVYMKNISKFFGNFTALDNVELRVKKGTIHALLGENGAGKSTLMNILYGIYNADVGQIFINGSEKNIANPIKAIEFGIGMVHQHFMLVETQTVLENIMLGSEETIGFFGVLNKNQVKKDILELSEQYGLYIDPDAHIHEISVGMQQRVEIIKTLYRGSEIIILDEPSAVLTPQEIVELISIMNNLTKDGKTIIIITHKLEEIKLSAQYCTIIRRGKYIDTVNVSDVTESDLANLMVGREVNLNIEKKQSEPGELVFEINDLHVKDQRNIMRVKGLNLKVRAGEIVGLAGIDGNGQKELIEAITNLVKAEKGSIKINGEEISNTTPNNTIKKGISTIHEDRHKRGLILDFTVEENAIIEKYNQVPFAKKGFLQYDEINAYAKVLIKLFDVRPSGSENQPIRELSGGNQQKMIIAREVSNNPDLLIAVQPTRGLDVGAIEFVRKSIVEQRDRGRAVLLISFELDEVMDLSDRLGVLYDGKIAKIFDNEKTPATEQELGLLMAGGGTLDE